MITCTYIKRSTLPFIIGAILEACPVGSSPSGSHCKYLQTLAPNYNNETNTRRELRFTMLKHKRKNICLDALLLVEHIVLLHQLGFLLRLQLPNGGSSSGTQTIGTYAYIHADAIIKHGHGNLGCALGSPHVNSKCPRADCPDVSLSRSITSPFELAEYNAANMVQVPKRPRESQVQLAGARAMQTQ